MMHRKAVLVAASFLFVLPGALSGQEAPQLSTADEIELSTADEIELARSAAPAAVSAEADVWVLQEGTFVRAVHGSNGNACIVARGQDPRGLYPICYDEEGARTVLRREIREVELRHEGMTQEEIDGIVATEIGSGELPIPRRPAMSYMFSSGQRLYPGGQDLGNWKPHVMLYMPFATIEDFGLTENTDQVMVINQGEPHAFLLVVVPDFVDPGASTAASR